MLNVSATPATSLTEVLKDKVVVIDTSSLLTAGTGLLNSLQDCTVVIPAIVVYELEAKRSHLSLGYLARQWLHLLEEMRVTFGEGLSTGVDIPGHEGVKLRVEPNHSAQEVLPNYLRDGSHDSTILSVAANLRDDKAVAEDVVLLSNDMPMRIHATLDVHLPAYELTAPQLTDSAPFTGVYEVAFSEEAYLQFTAELSDPKGKASRSLLTYTRDALGADVASTFRVNYTYDGVSVASALSIDGKLDFIARKTKASGITAKTIEQDTALALLKATAQELPIVSIGGGAGTGKTLLTVAAALEGLKGHSYEKIVVFRSLHEMGQGQEMGFLPGGVDEKMEAWAGAVLDAVDVLARANKPLKKNATVAEVEKQKAEAKRYREMIEVQPITYLRGRSLANTFIILDEAQNFSRVELLNIISRVGNDSKIVLLADALQVDNRFLSAGKDADIWSVIDDLKSSDMFAHVTLTRTERSRVAELASSILERG